MANLVEQKEVVVLRKKTYDDGNIRMEIEVNGTAEDLLVGYEGFTRSLLCSFNSEIDNPKEKEILITQLFKSFQNNIQKFMEGKLTNDN